MVDIIVTPPSSPPVQIGVPDQAPPKVEILGGAPGPPGPPGPPPPNLLHVYSYDGDSYIPSGGSFYIGPELPEDDGITPVEGDLWADMDVP